MSKPGISQVSHSQNWRQQWQSKDPTCYNNDRVLLLVEAMAIIFTRTFCKISGLVRFLQFFFVCSCRSICKNRKKNSIQQNFPLYGILEYLSLAVKKCLSDDMRWNREKWKAGNHWELKAGRLVWATSAQTTEWHVQTTEQPHSPYNPLLAHVLHRWYWMLQL